MGVIEELIGRHEAEVKALEARVTAARQVLAGTTQAIDELQVQIAALNKQHAVASAELEKVHQTAKNVRETAAQEASRLVEESRTAAAAMMRDARQKVARAQNILVQDGQ